MDAPQANCEREPDRDRYGRVYQHAPRAIENSSSEGRETSTSSTSSGRTPFTNPHLVVRRLKWVVICGAL